MVLNYFGLKIGLIRSLEKKILLRKKYFVNQSQFEFFFYQTCTDPTYREPLALDAFELHGAVIRYSHF